MKKSPGKSTRDWIGFNDIPLMLIGIPVLALITPVLFFGASWEDGFSCLVHNTTSGIFITSAYWFGDRVILLHFRKRFPTYAQIPRRLMFTTGAVMAYTGLVIGCMVIFQMITGIEIMVMPKPISIPRKIVGSLTATALVLMLYETVYFLMLWKASLIEAERLKQEQTRTQLEALKNQVNPHFLFNSLNTLISLIPEDQNKAVEFTQKLSHVYRIILDINDRSAITLQEEMRCVNDFLYLIKTRFDESFSFEVNIREEDHTKYIAPLSVQMLIENAIKHNVVSIKKPLHITITSQGDALLVSNNLQLRNDTTRRKGLGLDNISQRNELIFQKEIIINTSETHFEVILPLIAIEEK